VVPVLRLTQLLLLALLMSASITCIFATVSSSGERQERQGDVSFVTLQKYIFASLNRHQRLKELVFSIFLHLNTNTTKVLKILLFKRKSFLQDSSYKVQVTSF